MFRVCEVTVKLTAGIRQICIHFFPIPKKFGFISDLGA